MIMRKVDNLLLTFTIHADNEHAEYGWKLKLLKCYSRQLMHWDTFKQDNYSTAGGDGGM